MSNTRKGFFQELKSFFSEWISEYSLDMSTNLQHEHNSNNY